MMSMVKRIKEKVSGYDGVPLLGKRLSGTLRLALRLGSRKASAETRLESSLGDRELQYIGERFSICFSPRILRSRVPRK
jgi:hypothetical protein